MVTLCSGWTWWTRRKDSPRPAASGSFLQEHSDFDPRIDSTGLFDAKMKEHYLFNHLSFLRDRKS